MTDLLSRLSPAPGARHAEKRLGRGIGSGLGKTCGRGSKGQKARQPGGLGKLQFQGGQTPMQRRLPKRGFNVPFPVKTAEINVESLEQFGAESTVDENALREARLLSGKVERIKILGSGELTKALTVRAHAFSHSAREKIEKAGGTVVDLADAPSPEPS